MQSAALVCISPITIMQMRKFYVARLLKCINALNWGKMGYDAKCQQISVSADIRLQNWNSINDVTPGTCGAVAAAGLMMCPLASFTSRFTRSAVGMNRVTSPITCRICGFASIVAELDSRRPVSSLTAGAALCGGFMMLGGALNTPGWGPAAGGACSAGGGMLGGRPGGRTRRGGGTPTTNVKILRC